MGFITASNKKQTDAYLQAADAIKYLAYLDKNAEYSDIAKFLMRHQFDRLVAESTYAKKLNETFYCVDEEYNEQGDFIAPAQVDEYGELYSAGTRHFLIHVATSNNLDEEDGFGGLSPFNLYWKKKDFQSWIKGILAQEALVQDADLIHPLDIDETLATIRKAESDISQAEGEYSHQSGEIESMQARINSLEAENKKLQAELEKRPKPETQIISPSGIGNQTKQEVTKTTDFHERPATLKATNAAFSKFWGNANPIESDTHPRNDDVIEWLKTQGINNTKAQQIAAIIRPKWGAKGRRPEK